MKKYIFLLLVIFCSGCVNYYEERLASAVGISESELIRRFCNPTSVYNSEAQRFLQYEDKKFSCFEGHCSTRWCNARFTIINGRVANYSYDGNSCVRRIPY